MGQDFLVIQYGMVRNANADIQETRKAPEFQFNFKVKM